MLQLPVAADGLHMTPAVVFEHSQGVADLHGGEHYPAQCSAVCTKYFPGRDYEVTCPQWPAEPKI